ncbi:MAG: tannase/feruloyl esterase family alpha/beta hydrolase, partial [Bradyrhizobium sp.]|nr:tannase/feruloyl esterase family alpha/beta hydrolase [Bradyrhizobium sp.]
MLMERAYGSKPNKIYFVGSSEGGREGLTMAQRYPDDFDGIFARVPVINWVGLQHAGTRAGLATMGDGWIRPAQVKLVHDAVLAACDAKDGVADALVQDAVGCKAHFDPAKLLCAAGVSGDQCLSEAQLTAIRTLHSPYKFSFTLANGINEYPGWGVSGEATKSFGPTGGWSAWWLGSAPPALPPVPANGIAWVYGAGGIAHIFARDPNFDVRKYRPEDFAARVRAVSALMDSTNPDLGAFKARGGKLIMLENMADYAQSPYAGIGYFKEVQKRMGEAVTAEFMRLYTASGVDHVGSGGPSNVDMLSVLVDWVEKGSAPGDLVVVEQQPALPIAIDRSLPLCRWPA